MKVRTLGTLAAVGALAMLPVAANADSPRDRATGGGQVLLDPKNPPQTGALDTVAFTAQRARGVASDSTLATGQVQVNRRSGAEGTQVKFHGIVECLVVVGGDEDGSGKAYISGYQRGTEDDEGGPVPFELWVNDGGSGQNERSGDQGLVWYGPETEDNDPDQQAPGNFTPPQEDELCGIEEDPLSKRPNAALMRGNYQVHNAP